MAFPPLSPLSVFLFRSSCCPWGYGLNDNGMNTAPRYSWEVADSGCECAATGMSGLGSYASIILVNYILSPLSIQGTKYRDKLGYMEHAGSDLSGELK